MSFFDWPGKSAVGDDPCEHPAVYHMLDVAAVAERLISPFSIDHRLRGALVLLIALHDLGKISDSFRRMLKEDRPQVHRHWELSEALLHSYDQNLCARIGGGPMQRNALYAAAAGHHGRPPDLPLGPLPKPPRSREMHRVMMHVGSGEGPAGEVIEAFCDLWPEASFDGLTDGEALRLSWWLPGLCAAADWIGSNTRWFEALPPGPGLSEYLTRARVIANRAVTEAGLAGATVCDGPVFDFALRPMQQACKDVALADGPMLAVIEDETGAGKTEAALILAHRMALAGKGRGIYFALPTMATADAMFARTAKVIGRMFSNPSLTLAHGKSDLSKDFRDLVEGGATGEDAASCTTWLAESRRRALLADVGVGTIDQALLSVLPVKHQSLRHFGLSSKILIVDEVHEMGEPYVAKELERLLQMHRAAGGSAILLTATLPLELRAMLLATYGGRSETAAYPALSVAGGQTVTGLRADERPSKGPVKVARVESVESAADLIAAGAAAGAACVWIRNAVDEAIASVELLRARGIAAHLLHARYTLADRKRIEKEVLARVGKDGTGREGFVLVGTQVLEASLDLDFDLMVSDVAPVAALIQRAGRLWRHMAERPRAGRPVPDPVLHVLSPDPDSVSDDRWLQSTLGRGAWVYSVADVWRSARVIFARGGIDAPTGLRGLIEAVHGPEAEDAPKVLLNAEAEIIGKRLGQSTLALHNLVDLGAGYRMGGRGNNDATYPTRPGDETRTLMLARRTGHGLRPWADGAGPEAWALSEVSVRVKRLKGVSLPDQSAPEIVAVTRDWPDWKQAEARLCPVGEDGAICEGLRYDAECGLVFVSSD
ncbi:CRISPR-associated helicase Cas3' [Roseinatronobacter alkalisoli]|uniref:CRISPR-associated helicase Cas3 n=1 Tax=Roseinatronobacter alkalisoli TaxID=3028235 RepID=A0ABT5T661_9RHOB|nr:CRISPR-associated helicase Cas3' [Roseinatronobacter sp. HJB301]MDD7970600.1 CRISPR-associated helicase Cas3' [Roseinatronobacter sp. HJB301]